MPKAGHFDGMVTESLLFLNLVRPDRTYWGEKDFQQLRIIETLTQDLRLPVRVERCATKREPDGLALSSRNARLTPTARALAPRLQQILLAARARLLAGEPVPAALDGARQALLDAGFEVEYLMVGDEETLTETLVLDPAAPVRLFAAAVLDGVRLIDNVRVTEDGR